VALLESISKWVLGDPNKKKIQRYEASVAQINALEPEYQALSDAELAQCTVAFQERLEKGEALDDLLPEAFAVVREASRRVLGMRHFDVQLMGGLALHEGKIAEMKTGEGKTLVCTLPAYLNALTGQGVFVVTVNDYLARRDFQWMGKVYAFLGLNVGLIQSGMPYPTRQHAYTAHITYGTNNEFGFDYLRDNLATDLGQCCQLRRHYAILDEVDSILIDEARTPLIISGPVQDAPDKYQKMAKWVRQLTVEKHYTVDEKHKNVVLTEEGIRHLESALGLEDLYSVETMDQAHMAIQCLKAKALFRRDVDYVIKDGEVMIVDEFTGRILEGRRYSDGLHQAIEAMETLKVKEESQTLASITFQNYFRMFDKLAGMTGTAATEADEFLKIYNLDVVTIPTHRDMVRDDMPDTVYRTRSEKYRAIVNEVKNLYDKGQPVLVGTISIEASELLSAMLRKTHIPHRVLNAKYHEQEAEIIAQAGQEKTVTIATNMAGRGTDIVLGEGVAGKGGLFVLGTERHESRRIDNQLRGRSGRQGDTGASRFYISLEDDLMRLFGSDRISALMVKMGLPEDTPIEHPLISKSIERAQRKVEQYHFSMRKQVLQYDDVLNQQRDTIYTLRQQIMKKDHLDQRVSEMIDRVIAAAWQDYVTLPAERGSSADWEGLAQKCEEYVQPGTPLLSELMAIGEKQRTEWLRAQWVAAYESRKAAFPVDLFDEIVREILLRSIDRKWMDHLHNMDVLRDGIGLRAWGQRDPLIEYKVEAYDMFGDLLAVAGEEALSAIQRFRVVQQQAPTPSEHVDPTAELPGRNELCPCGSGKKYKKCCMSTSKR
jgi:preprotein translocase subunit SecA